jgi:hypothetical protein
MSWLGGSSPNAPTNLQITENNTDNTITWINSTSSNLKYNILYRSTTTPVDITDENNMLDILSSSVTTFSDNTISNSTKYYYKVSTVNKYDLESGSNSEIASSTVNSNITLDDFETSEGHFTWKPTDSGSTTGVDATSTADRVTTEAHNGSASEKVVLIDDATSTNNWFVRLVSGSGVPSNNIAITGNQVGLWIKTNTAQATSQFGVWIDDSDGTEKSILIDVINDNAWHYYRWDLSDATQWTALSGNGEITSSSITLDAVIYTAPSASPDWTIYLDDVNGTDVTPVPVELTKFEAIAKNGIIELFWETATEVRNYGFEIQKSIEANSDLPIQWETIGFIEGAGNSNSPKQYSFVASENLANDISFRLKQIDFDGDYKYSDVLTVTQVMEDLAKMELFQNYPNPFNPSTKISFRITRTENVKLTVYNILGEKVAELLNEEMESGLHSINFNTSNAEFNLSSGLYIYRLETSSFAKSMKMLFLK